MGSRGRRRAPGGGQAGLAAARLQKENVCLLIMSTKRLCAMLCGARRCPVRLKGGGKEGQSFHRLQELRQG